MLYRTAIFSVTLGDPLLLQITSFSTYCIVFHIFVVSRNRDFKLDRRLIIASPRPWMSKSSLVCEVAQYAMLEDMPKSMGEAKFRTLTLLKYLNLFGWRYKYVGPGSGCAKFDVNRFVRYEAAHA